MEAAKIQTAFDILEDIFQCPVCLEIPRSLLLQCRIGHHICNFCRNQINECPLCKEDFIPTRILFTDELAQKFEDMKFTILEQMESTKRKCQNTSADISIQTDFKVDKTCTSVQTDNTDYRNVEQKNAGTQTAHFDSFNTRIREKENDNRYPCCIGTCIVQLPYRRLICHVKDCHKDVFYEVVETNGKFSEKCTLYNDSLPQTYDFAFFAVSMGIFFFNIEVRSNGQFFSVIQTATTCDISKQFVYNLLVRNRANLCKVTGKVTSALTMGEKAVSSGYCFAAAEGIHKKIKDGSIECTLEIRKVTQELKMK